MKNFARVIGVLFGSARSHTYRKSGHIAAPLPSKIQAAQNGNIRCTKENVSYTKENTRYKKRIQITENGKWNTLPEFHKRESNFGGQKYLFETLLISVAERLRCRESPEFEPSLRNCFHT